MLSTLKIATYPAVLLQTVEVTQEDAYGKFCKNKVGLEH